MGAWGSGCFDNDDAGDWVAELKTSDPALIASTLRRVTTAGDNYLEASDCSNALAAAEMVAALRGHPAADLDIEAKAWVQTYQFTLGADLILDTLAAVKRIRGNSELKELWEESDHYQDWLIVLDNLEHRLTAA